MRIRQADDDTLEDARFRVVERALDLDRRDVLAACLDHVLEAVLEPEHAVLVEITDVAGVEPSEAERLVGGCVIVQVAGHCLRAAVDDLADLAGPQERPILAHDRRLHVRQLAADGAGVHKLVLRREQRRQRRHLSLAEAEREVALERVDRLAQVLVGHRRHRVADRVEAREVMLSEPGQLHQRADHDRQAEEVRDPLALDDVQHGRRIEPALEHERRAAQDRSRREPERGRVEERHEDEVAPVVLRVPRRGDRERVHVDV